MVEEDTNEEIDEENEEEFETIELILSEEDIEELMLGLEKLKQTKSNFHFPLEDNSEMIIYHEESPDLEVEEGEEDENEN